jgi:hypothetical protein
MKTEIRVIATDHTLYLNGEDLLRRFGELDSTGALEEVWLRVLMEIQDRRGCFADVGTTDPFEVTC